MVRCRTYSGLFYNLYLLDDSSTTSPQLWQPKMSLDIASCPQVAKSSCHIHKHKCVGNPNLGWPTVHQDRQSHGAICSIIVCFFFLYPISVLRSASYLSPLGCLDVFECIWVYASIKALKQTVLLLGIEHPSDFWSIFKFYFYSLSFSTHDIRQHTS